MGIGAYNLWEILPGIPALSDEDFAFGRVTYRSAGLLLFAAATLLVLWRLKEALLFPRSERQHLLGVLLAGALTTSAMFLFCTEMHERYQFAFVLLALPVAAASRRRRHPVRGDVVPDPPQSAGRVSGRRLGRGTLSSAPGAPASHRCNRSSSSSSSPWAMAPKLAAAERALRDRPLSAWPGSADAPA